METQEAQKPRLVPAGQGFSALNTIQYKNRFLYSKYNPSGAIEKAVSSLTVLPGTIVLVCSPALWYALPLLREKCGDSSRIIAFEADDALYGLSRDADGAQDVPLYCTGTLMNLDALVRSLCETGLYRRVIRVDFSAGVQFAPALYEKVALSLEDIVASFWKSRLTLTALGRLFSRNTLRNLSLLPQGVTLSDVRGRVARPLLVCGAGESLDRTTRKIKGREKDFFILAADAAIPALRAHGITPDAAVGMESQLAIQRAYLGLEGSTFPVFLDISSRNQVAREACGRTVWFCSQYTGAPFLTDISRRFFKGSTLPALGSVGLAATYIALALRRDSSVPVFVTGLDFSFSAGRTHAASAPAELARLCTGTRLCPPCSYAALVPPVAQVETKDGSRMYAPPSLSLYAKMFREQFAGTPCLFDAAECGMSLGIERRQLPERTRQNAGEDSFMAALPHGENRQERGQLRDFYGKQDGALRDIKDLLVHGEDSPARKEGLTLTEQLQELLLGREYLYLHFPDGYRLSMETAFLKRVRAELEPFMRIVQTALERL